MIKRKFGEIGSILYKRLIFPFVRIGIEVKTKSVMRQGSYVNKGTQLEGRNYIGKNTVLSNAALGFGSYVIDNGTLSDITVGKYCSIGPHFKCIGGLHPTGRFVSTHPAFYSKNNVSGLKYCDKNCFSEYKYVDENNRFSHKIGNDVWIGANVSILEGVTVGDGCIVGAGSLINKDLEPYGVYAGTPARLIKKRFNDDEITKLLEFKWWDKGEEWIKEHAEGFEDIDKMIEIITFVTK